MRRGELEGRLNAEFYRAEYRGLLARLRTRYPFIAPLSKAAEIVCGPFGSAITLEDYAAAGVPLLRISNIARDGSLDLEDVVYISHEKAARLAGTQVRKGDLAISQRGTIGMPAVVSDAFPAFNISANLIAIRELRGFSPEYLQLVLASRLGTQQIARVQSGQVHPKITTDDIAGLLIPPSARQGELVAAMEIANATRRAKLAEADALLSSLDDYLLDLLGIAPPPTVRRTFAIRSNQLTNALGAERYASLQLEQVLPWTTTVADAVELIEARTIPSRTGAAESWDWIRIDDLSNQPWQVEKLRTATGAEIEGAFYPVQENDVLLARLGPTILNAKFVLAPAPERKTIASPEFLVLRCKEGWMPEVVLWLLRLKLLRDVMYLRSRGGTPSRYRLDGPDLLSIPFPSAGDLPQVTIATEVRRRREQARRLRTEAEAGWAEAKRWFENQLLGPAD